MKFTLSWLKDHINTTADISIIESTLTNIGLEVEKIEDRLFLTTEGGIEIPVPKSKLSSVEIGQKIAFGFRAEDIVPVKFGNKPQQFWDMKSKVNLAEPLGTETLIFTNLGNLFSLYLFVKPIMSSVTSICPLQCLLAPIPIVGTNLFL